MIFHKKSKFSTFDLTMYLCIHMHLRFTFPSPQMFTQSCEDFLHLSGVGLLSEPRELEREEDIKNSRKFWFMDWNPGFFLLPSLENLWFETFRFIVLALREGMFESKMSNGELWGAADEPSLTHSPLSSPSAVHSGSNRSWGPLH